MGGHLMGSMLEFSEETVSIGYDREKEIQTNYFK